MLNKNVLKVPSEGKKFSSQTAESGVIFLNKNRKRRKFQSDFRETVTSFFCFYFGWTLFFKKKPRFVGGRIAHCLDFRTDKPPPLLHFSKERIVGAATLAQKKDGIVATYPHIKKRSLKRESFYCQGDKGRGSISGLETKISSDSGDLKYDTDGPF